MLAGARSALTLVALALLLVAGAAWGWASLTQPLPERTVVTGCQPIDVAAGETVMPAQVTVSVLNAGGREGLAGQTMSQLIGAGFVAGESDNAPAETGVALAQIWTAQPGSAPVRLVKSWLPQGTTVERRDAPGTADGVVVVVVGDDFQELRQGRAQVTARADVQFCAPTP